MERTSNKNIFELVKKRFVAFLLKFSFQIDDHVTVEKAGGSSQR